MFLAPQRPEPPPKFLGNVPMVICRVLKLSIPLTLQFISAKEKRRIIRTIRRGSQRLGATGLGENSSQR